MSLDDATKIVGCWNGLAKRTATSGDGEDTGFGTDPRPMQRAVTFLRDIKSSQKLADQFATGQLLEMSYSVISPITAVRPGLIANLTR